MDRVRKQVGVENQVVQKYTGRDICIAVLDSGVCSHPDLAGRIIEFRNFLSDKNRSDSIYDDYGHGTHVPCLLIYK